MDTKTGSAGQKNWAMWAAMALLAAGAGALLYVLFVASSKPEESADVSRFATGEMARLVAMDAPPPLPTRSLRDASNAETTLAAYQGEVIVLNLWATWCAPCVEEMPTLGAVQRRFGDRLRVVTVSVDAEGQRARAQEQLAELSGGSLPFLLDITRGILFDVQAPGMPVTIIYDREGQELARLAGGADWDSPEAVAMLEAAVAGTL
ncbi:MAG: TlpA family protein disulfide reductase [Hyphomonadaceae bacterium]|nr:TlpA family protein disulfide reductase [Hyphomonadaceae bacterium]